MLKLGWLLSISTLAISLHFTNKESHDQVARDIANTKQLELDETQGNADPLNNRRMESLKIIQKAIN